MKHTDITDDEWNMTIESIQRPDNSFDLRDLAAAVMAKFNVDEPTAKRLVRRNDQRMTRNADRLWKDMARSRSI